MLEIENIHWIQFRMAGSFFCFLYKLVFIYLLTILIYAELSFYPDGPSCLELKYFIRSLEQHC